MVIATSLRSNFRIQRTSFGSLGRLERVTQPHLYILRSSNQTKTKIKPKLRLKPNTNYSSRPNLSPGQIVIEINQVVSSTALPLHNSAATRSRPSQSVTVNWVGYINPLLPLASSRTYHHITKRIFLDHNHIPIHKPPRPKINA